MGGGRRWGGRRKGGGRWQLCLLLSLSSSSCLQAAVAGGEDLAGQACFLQLGADFAEGEGVQCHARLLCVRERERERERERDGMDVCVCVGMILNGLLMTMPQYVRPSPLSSSEFSIFCGPHWTLPSPPSPFSPPPPPPPPPPLTFVDSGRV